jgi:hypothetical protein
MKSAAAHVQVLSRRTRPKMAACAEEHFCGVGISCLKLGRGVPRSGSERAWFTSCGVWFRGLDFSSSRFRTLGLGSVPGFAFKVWDVTRAAAFRV